LDPANDLANLKILLNQNSAQDNYSKARLLLEIARQETLRGDLKAARAVLNQACPLIYAARNRRYSILLNMRYAYLHLLEGELHAALNLIGNARRELDPTVDQTLSFEVSGLECQILRALGKQQCIGELQSHIAQLELAKDRSGRAIHRRIKHRDATSGEIVAYHGDDPLGDLLDLAARSPDQAIPVAIERGYHGILRHAVPDAAGKRLLLFDLVPDTLVIFDRGSVAVQRSSAVLRAIAKRLMLGEASKQQLIETVWGYRYQPLKHDALVYRSMSRFRQLLGERAHWLTATEQGYQLSGEVAIRFHHTKPRLVETPQIEMPQQKPEESSQADINFRQMQILAHLKERDMIDVKYCSEAFSVSEITARRDLSELVQMSYLSRVGNGRATRYRLGGAHGPSH
jgi:DNA-binding winged helix-turn-helix (wHTH) protein